jgi:CheY-like chemotaxis protein
MTTGAGQNGRAGASGRLRALLVEDEPLVALMIEDMLDDLGVEVARSVTTLADAMAAVETEIDFALLDINLKGERSFPAAEALRKRGKPFLFVTGYGTLGTHGTDFDVTVLQKPFTIADLRAALTRIIPDFG